MFHVYILASWSRVLYIGVTGDLARRVGEHRDGLVPGFTARYRVRRLVFSEPFASIEQAIAREKCLKGWRRSRKIELVQASNPRWSDLARGWIWHA